MLSQVPVPVWLLIAIALIALAPARYVYRYIAHSPSGRDLIVMRPAEQLEWRTPVRLALNLAALAALAALGVFIFTPAAARLAQAPSFWPVVLAAGGVWALSTVPRGLASGRIEPMARGFNNRYQRATQPKRFWASLAWNTVFGCLMLWLGLGMYPDAPRQALKAECGKAWDPHAAQAMLSACNQLIDGHRTSPEGPAYWIAVRAGIQYRLGDYRHALADYGETIRLDPSDAGARYNHGLVEELLGDRPRALVDYGDAIRLGTDNADVHLRRGLIFLDTRRYDEAAADFTRAHELRPGDAMALADRGISYAWKRDGARAEADFAAVRATDPENPVLLRGEALLSMNAGDLEGAVDHLTTALSHDPADRWSLVMRASLYRGLGEDEKAQADTDTLRRLQKAGPAQQ